jgi:uncharacterized membrane protein YraQ (UPF0718 family)/YHS domain-containing protein
MAIDPICGMSVNEKTGLRISQGKRIFYFCSQHCLEKFSREKHIMPSEKDSCCSTHPRQHWYQNKIILVTLVFAFLIFLSNYFPILVAFREKLFTYVKMIWWTILLGIVIGGVIEYFVPREYISHILSRKKKRSVFYGVIMGFFMSVCSHGILALAIQLYKKGAATPSVVAFLLASPWANFPLTLMLIGFFGLMKALYLIVAALFIAVVTGLLFQVLEKKGAIETNPQTSVLAEDFSILDDVKFRRKNYHFSWKQAQKDIQGVFSGMVSLSNMVLWWILVGMGLASAAGAYIPEHIFHQYMGPTVAGMLLTLALATVLEICSDGTAPLAFELYRQTGAFGNSLVFMMAGVATDYTEIGLLWQNIGMRTALWLPVITVPQVLFWGWLGNILF